MLSALLLSVLFGQAERPDPKDIRYYATPDTIYTTALQRKLGVVFRCLAISPDGKFLAAGTWEDIIVWDIATAKEVATIHQGLALNAVAFSPKGHLLAGVNNVGVITLTDTSTWKLKNTLKNRGGFYRLAFSPSGFMLLSGGTADDNDLLLWDVQKGIVKNRIHVDIGNTPIDAVAFSPSGKYFAASWAGTPTSKGGAKIKIFDTDTGKEIRDFNDFAFSVAFSPDNSKLASVGDSSDHRPGSGWILSRTNIKLWDVATGKPILLPTRVFQHRLLCVSWSPDGKRLAVGRDEGAEVLDFEKPKQLVVIRGRSGGKGICFSPDGKYLYTAGGSRVAERWKLDAPPEPFPPKRMRD